MNIPPPISPDSSDHARLIEQFMDALLQDAQADPPPGLDVNTVAQVRTLVAANRPSSLALNQKARMWKRALAQSRADAYPNGRIPQSLSNRVEKDTMQIALPMPDAAQRHARRLSGWTLALTAALTLVTLAAFAMMGGPRPEPEPLGLAQGAVSQTPEPPAVITATPIPAFIPTAMPPDRDISIQPPFEVHQLPSPDAPILFEIVQDYHGLFQVMGVSTDGLWIIVQTDLGSGWVNMDRVTVMTGPPVDAAGLYLPATADAVEARALSAASGTTNPMCYIVAQGDTAIEIYSQPALDAPITVTTRGRTALGVVGLYADPETGYTDVWYLINEYVELTGWVNASGVQWLGTPCPSLVNEALFTATPVPSATATMTATATLTPTPVQ